jgi:hypothetical protein
MLTDGGYGVLQRPLSQVVMVTNVKMRTLCVYNDVSLGSRDQVPT